MSIHHARKARIISPYEVGRGQVLAIGTVVDVEHVDNGDGMDYHRLYYPNELGGMSTSRIEMYAFAWLPDQPPIIAENE